ncbi:MAG: hypothetical protein U0R80_14175 [Nocardioidaceae bacterium]
MGTIDLTTPATEPLGLLDGLPRRLTLTLPELHLVAQAAGGAPLPFELVEPRTPAASDLDDRLGAGRASTEAASYAAALAALHDPRDSLTRRGLMSRGVVDPGLTGAVGLLATPRLAVDVDVAAGSVQAKAWHRQGGEAVASLGTVDGLVFELAWFPAARWADELARAAVLPEDLALGGSEVPTRVTLPPELAESSAEAVRSHRADLLPVLLGHDPGAVRGPDGSPLAPADAERVLTALAREARGRLRVLATDAGSSGRGPVGVIAWVLVGDGWRALRPRREDDTDVLEVVEVGPEDLAAELAPVLAEVSA